MHEPRGWHARGYLPHIEARCTPQFVTWRLHDSLPQSLLDQWHRDTTRIPWREANRLLRSRVEQYLDEGHGSALLRNPVAGKIVQDGILFYHGRKYLLHAWTVMPNHVHALFTPFDSFELGDIVKPLKGFTSREIHKALGGSGRLWQRDFFDVLIRDEAHFERVLNYIEWNPVKAKLCTDPTKWPFGSGNPVARARLRENEARAVEVVRNQVQID